MKISPAEIMNQMMESPQEIVHAVLKAHHTYITDDRLSHLP